MQLIKQSEFIAVDKIVQRKSDLAYVKQNQLVLKNCTSIDLPEKGYVVSEYAADFKVYLYEDGIGHVYYLNDVDSFELLHSQKAQSGRVLSSTQILLSDLGGSEGTHTYYENGKQKWQKERQKRYLGNNDSTIVTSPNFKMTSLEVRDLATFTVQKVIETNQDFKVSHHTNVIGDTLIFFQKRSIQGSPHLEVIATAINLIDGSIIWTNTYEGAHWFLLNHSDQQLYSFYGVWENKYKTMYLETINPKTGEHTKEKIANDGEIASIPWLTKIANNIMYIADSDTAGTCIHALELSTKKLIARCDLNLNKGVKIAEPYIAGDDLWVLDTEKTLHQLKIKSQ